MSRDTQIQKCIKNLQSNDDFEKEEALRLLINSPLYERGLSPIITYNGLDQLLLVLKEDENPYFQGCAAWAIANLASQEQNHVALCNENVLKVVINVLTTESYFELVSKCLWVLTNLASREPNRKLLCQFGVPQLLAGMLKSQSQSPALISEVSKPLRNLLQDLEGQKLFAVNSMGIALLVNILNTNQYPAIQNDILNVILTLAVTTDLMRKIIVAAGALTPVVYLLSSEDEALVDLALRVLIALSLTEDNEMKILHSGAVLPVIDLLNSTKKNILEQSALLLSNLSCNAHIQQSLRYSGLVKPLLLLLQSPHPELQEQAARLITNLAMDDYNRIELVDAGALPPLEELSAKATQSGLQRAVELAVNNLNVPVSDEVRNSIIDTFTSTDDDEVSDLTARLSNVMTPQQAAAAPQPQRPAPQRPKRAIPKTAQEQFTLRKQAAVIHPQLLRREKIARELYQTEKSYVESLHVVVNVFFKPIMDSILKEQPIIPAEEMKTIFSIIEIITKINEEFLKKLHIKMERWNPSSTLIGDIMLDLTEKLKYYTRYVNNYDNTMEAYSNCLQTYPKFKELLQQCATNSETKGLDLLSFLIMPVQRIPRYIMLLEDLLKNTTKDHPDWKNLTESLSKTKEIANFLNESKRKAENATRVVKIQDSLIGDEKLVAEGRSFIREGSFVMKSKKASEYCNLFLLTDILLHTVAKKDKFKVINKIPLHELSVTEVEDEGSIKNALKISWAKETLTVTANSPADRNIWVKEIRKAIQEHNASRAS